MVEIGVLNLQAGRRKYKRRGRGVEMRTRNERQSMTTQWQPYREPLSTTLIRTGAIAVAKGRSKNRARIFRCGTGGERPLPSGALSWDSHLRFGFLRL